MISKCDLHRRREFNQYPCILSQSIPLLAADLEPAFSRHARLAPERGFILYRKPPLRARLAYPLDPVQASLPHKMTIDDYYDPALSSCDIYRHKCQTTDAALEASPVLVFDCQRSEISRLLAAL